MEIYLISHLLYFEKGDRKYYVTCIIENHMNICTYIKYLPTFVCKKLVLNVKILILSKKELPLYLKK